MNEESIQKLLRNYEETMKKVRVFTEFCDIFQSDVPSFSANIAPLILQIENNSIIFLTFCRKQKICIIFAVY